MTVTCPTYPMPDRPKVHLADLPAYGGHRPHAVTVESDSKGLALVSLVARLMPDPDPPAVVDDSPAALIARLTAGGRG